MVKKNLDFRSDTVTLPTPEMREAMLKATLGDDVYGEDPTVNQLEELAADILGKEAGLFVTSGTMGNAVSILTHTHRGDEVILEESSHIYVNEVGGLAVLGSLMARTVKGDRGWIKPEDIHRAVRRDNIHLPPTSLLCIENTHNSAGGVALDIGQMKTSWNAAKEHDLYVHLDGARVFNAAVACEVDVKEIAKYSDSVQFCLSKGLAAPIGSMVVGSKDFIRKARKYRKMLGGGMRQVGVIAAPGIVALTSMVGRLKEDHENASLLGKGLQKLGIKLRYPVETNMVYIDLSDLGWKREDWGKACSKIGWTSNSGRKVRLCTHYGIIKEDIIKFLDEIGEIIQG